MKQKENPFQTDKAEMCAFFGIRLIMGYHVLPSIRDYWSSQPDLQVPFVSNTMPRLRFETIRSALHFANNDEMLPRSHPQCDRAFKWGFKLWCRCDAVTGYLYQFDLYKGRKVSTEYGLGESVVVILSKKIEELCCHVFIDNFFNSPLLQVHMLQKKIYLCGTVRIDRKYMPNNFKPDKEMKRGDMDAMTANGITCVKWMDNRSVTLLSNFTQCSKDDVSLVLRRNAGCAEKLRVPCPTIVTLYTLQQIYGLC
ncbi:piggyBac transposable element-derived protein 4-like [Hydra vulgaris]|uniref:piggyBac transposable element-derived protein 4-like n=1 Tax=Hydra vulgaris TaxID=6087 RepID=UPI001F5FA8D6|nr:piggyBac transposable element-derived protein 4-like [Hydra vulgaris]